MSATDLPPGVLVAPDGRLLARAEDARPLVEAGAATAHYTMDGSAVNGWPTRPEWIVEVRLTSTTERIPWHECYLRRLPDGQVIRRVGQSAVHINGAVSPENGGPYWISADADGTVEVLK